MKLFLITIFIIVFTFISWCSNSEINRSENILEKPELISNYENNNTWFSDNINELWELSLNIDDDLNLNNFPIREERFLDTILLDDGSEQVLYDWLMACNTWSQFILEINDNLINSINLLNERNLNSFLEFNTFKITLLDKWYSKNYNWHFDSYHFWEFVWLDEWNWCISLTRKYIFSILEDIIYDDFIDFLYEEIYDERPNSNNYLTLTKDKFNWNNIVILEEWDEFPIRKFIVFYFWNNLVYRISTNNYYSDEDSLAEILYVISSLEEVY